MRIGELQAGGMAYHLGDALGSVRQLADATGTVTLARNFEPFGSTLISAGSGSSVWQFTGEARDASTGLTFLRARYLSSATGRFLSRDEWAGDLKAPLTLNKYLYVSVNPINFIDPTGLHGQPPMRKDCPIEPMPGHNWDCQAVDKVRALKSTFLDSATRHNKIPGMDNNGFAALLASTIIGERRLGRNSDFSTWQRILMFVEDELAGSGCVISAFHIEEARKNGDFKQVVRYVFNELPSVDTENEHIREIVTFASVGIGNVKLKTAADLWRGQTCTFDGQCTPVQVTKLQIKNLLGWTVDIDDPFGTQVISGPGEGYGGIYEPSKLESYQILAKQLYSNVMNIEYVAANMEAAALRATSLGITPTAFNSVAWHTKGVQTDEEILRLITTIKSPPQSAGHVDWVLDDVAVSLSVMNLTSSWTVNNETQYKNHP
jgi:RHS repeat-associated protein